MNPDAIGKLSLKQRRQVVAWLASHAETAPEPARVALRELADQLVGTRMPAKEFNAHSRQLARAMGLIPSTERRRSSGNPLAGLPKGPPGKPRNERERLEREQARRQSLADYYRGQMLEHEDMSGRLQARLSAMANEPQPTDDPELAADTPIEARPLSEEAKADNRRLAAVTAQRLDLGDGPAPSLEPVSEALMNGNVVVGFEEDVLLEAELPEGLSEENVVKTLHEERARYEFSVSVKRLNIDVEKKVVEGEDGSRTVYSASTSELGPPQYSVTWGALATLAVLVGQFAIPFNRLATMLTTSVKRFTAGGLSRLAKYVARRLVPVYLELADQIADARILAGDDTSCRVLEVSSYFAKNASKKERSPPPWEPYRTPEAAEAQHELYVNMVNDLTERRTEGEREAIAAGLPQPSLSMLVGRELAFESDRRDGKGPKESLNTTVATGRSQEADPASTIIFYRSHLGSLGNLLEMLLLRRKASARELTVQSDLSTTNLVVDPKLTSRFDIELAGCGSHARRPFAQYEDQDPVHGPLMLIYFKGLALYEKMLDDAGRNQENVLAIRGAECKELWEKILAVAKVMVSRWTKATPLGAAARYIIKHYEKLTLYLRNPRLAATNNLRERMLRTEKLIEKSSMFRQSIEGRAVLDILRTILQTAVAAGVPAQEYLVSVLKTPAEDLEAHPERYTPLAWKQRQLAPGSGNSPAAPAA